MRIIPIAALLATLATPLTAAAQSAPSGKLTNAPVPDDAVGDRRGGPNVGTIGRAAPDASAGQGSGNAYATRPNVLAPDGAGAYNSVTPMSNGTRVDPGTTGGSTTVGSSAGGPGAIGLGGTGAGGSTGLGTVGTTNNNTNLH